MSNMTRNPAFWCSRMLAVFSGNTLLWMVVVLVVLVAALAFVVGQIRGRHKHDPEQPAV